MSYQSRIVLGLSLKYFRLFVIIADVSSLIAPLAVAGSTYVRYKGYRILVASPPKNSAGMCLLAVSFCLSTNPRNVVWHSKFIFRRFTNARIFESTVGVSSAQTASIFVEIPVRDERLRTAIQSAVVFLDIAINCYQFFSPVATRAYNFQSSLQNYANRNSFF